MSEEDDVPFDGDTPDRSDADLIAAAQALIAEAQKEAPLTKERYDALKSELELLYLEADEPDDVREVIAEPLLRLEPGGEFEDSEDDDDESETEGE